MTHTLSPTAKFYSQWVLIAIAMLFIGGFLFTGNASFIIIVCLSLWVEQSIEINDLRERIDEN